MTRRAWLLAIGGLLAPRRAAALGVHVTGQLVDATSDLQDGYFALCGTETAVCHTRDAIAITVYPENPICKELRAMVGKDVQVSVFTVKP